MTSAVTALAHTGDLLRVVNSQFEPAYDTGTHRRIAPPLDCPLAEGVAQTLGATGAPRAKIRRTLAHTALQHRVALRTVPLPALAARR